MNGLYSNVGHKIKILAVILGILLLLGCIGAGIYFLTNTYTAYSYYSSPSQKAFAADDYIGWILMGSGVLSFLSSWILYGFGQLIEDTGAIRTIVEEGQFSGSSSPARTFDSTPSHGGSWICSRCETENKSTVSQCKKCGQYR